MISLLSSLLTLGPLISSFLVFLGCTNTLCSFSLYFRSLQPASFPSQRSGYQFPFKRCTATPSQALSGLQPLGSWMHQGRKKSTTLNYKPLHPPRSLIHIWAVGNDPRTHYFRCMLKPLPMDEGELIAKVVPPEYHDFFDVVFLGKKAKLMPPASGPMDHTIDLEGDQNAPLTATFYSVVWQLKLGILREFLDDMLGKGFYFGTSSAPWGCTSFSFAKKKGWNSPTLC